MKFRHPDFRFLLNLIICLLPILPLEQGLTETKELAVLDFEKPYYGLKRQGTSINPKEVMLIVIAWQPKGKGEPILSKSQLEQLYFGTENSVAHWFHENSQGRYRLIPHPVHPIVGPFESVYDWYFYWRNSPKYVRRELCGGEDIFCDAWQQNPYKVPPPVGDPHYYVRPSDGNVFYLDDEGYIGGHTHSWAEAIRLADQFIDYDVCDSNRDSEVSVDECVITVVKAQANTFGTARPVTGRDVPREDLKVDNVIIRNVNELYAAPPHGSDDLAVAIEEALHLAANLADQYPDDSPSNPNPPDRLSNDSRRPGQLALTDAGRRPVHIDPYHKLKWGWLNPQVVDRSGRYTLKDVATTGDALLIYSPFLGDKEFFILENRWRGSSYDRFRSENRGDGLALWHCIQDPSLSRNWARRAVHLRRVDPQLELSGRIKWHLTLFDGSHPDRDSDLNDFAEPQNIRFHNDIPSQIQIRNISPAGPVMAVDIIVAPEPGAILATKGKIKMLRVHAQGTGYGPPDHRLYDDAMVILESNPRLAFGVDINDADGQSMLNLLRLAFKMNNPVRLEYIASTAIGGQTIRVIEEYTDFRVNPNLEILIDSFENR